VNRSFETGKCARVLRNLLNNALTTFWRVPDVGDRPKA